MVVHWRSAIDHILPVCTTVLLVVSDICIRKNGNRVCTTAISCHHSSINCFCIISCVHHIELLPELCQAKRVVVTNHWFSFLTKFGSNQYNTVRTLRTIDSRG